jgi:hypothetical protein
MTALTPPPDSTLPPAPATTPAQPPRTKTNLVKSHRLQFDLPPSSMERLTTLKQKTEATSYPEVVKNALRLYEALIGESEAGKQFMVRDAAGMVSPYRLFP